VRDVGHPTRGFRRAYESWGGDARGDPWCGRPARYVRKTGLGRLSSTYDPVATQRNDSLLANALRGDDDAPGPRSMSTRRTVFPCNAAAATAVDATSAIDSDSRNSFRGFTLPQPPSNEPSHIDQQMRPPTTATANNHNLPRLRPREVPIQQ